MGWDETGPIVLVDNAVGVQNVPVDGGHWVAGYLARLQADGTPGTALGPSGCRPFSLLAPDRPGSLLAQQKLLCLPTGAATPGYVEAADLSGQVLWSAAVFSSSQGQPGGFALSPDGTRIAMDGRVAGHDGTSTAVPDNFQTRGWLDNSTIIGLLIGTPPNTMGILRMDTPTTVENWRFTGEFVGVISG